MKEAVQQSLRELPRGQFVLIKELVAESTIRAVSSASESQHHAADPRLFRLMALLKDVSPDHRVRCLAFLATLREHVAAADDQRVEWFSGDECHKFASRVLLHIGRGADCIDVETARHSLDQLAKTADGYIGHDFTGLADPELRDAVCRADEPGFEALCAWKSSLCAGNAAGTPVQREVDVWLDRMGVEGEARDRAALAVSWLCNAIEREQSEVAAGVTAYQAACAKRAVENMAEALDQIVSEPSSHPWLPVGSRGRLRPNDNALVHRKLPARLCWDRACIAVGNVQRSAGSLTAMHGAETAALESEMARLSAMCAVMRDGLHAFAPHDNFLVRLIHRIASAFRSMARDERKPDSLGAVTQRLQLDVAELGTRMTRSMAMCERVVQSFVDRPSVSADLLGSLTEAEMKSVVDAVRTLSAFEERWTEMKLPGGSKAELLGAAIKRLKSVSHRSAVTSGQLLRLAEMRHNETDGRDFDNIRRARLAANDLVNAEDKNDTARLGAIRDLYNAIAMVPEPQILFGEVLDWIRAYKDKDKLIQWLRGIGAVVAELDAMHRFDGVQFKEFGGHPDLEQGLRASIVGWKTLLESLSAELGVEQDSVVPENSARDARTCIENALGISYFALNGKPGLAFNEVEYVVTAARARARAVVSLRFWTEEELSTVPVRSLGKDECGSQHWREIGRADRASPRSVHRRWIESAMRPGNKHVVYQGAGAVELTSELASAAFSVPDSATAGPRGRHCGA